MNISKKAWSGFISRLRKIDDRAAAVMVAYMLDHDYASKQGRKELIDYAYAVATKYGEGAAEMACQMYDAVSEASSKQIKPAMPARTATYGEVARTVNGTLLQSQDPATIGAAVGRLVKTAGVDTTIQNAIRDGAEWAWIPSGDSCPFCMMLASQGWVRASEKVLRGNHASHIHNNCDCTFAIRHDGVSTVEGYDPDALRAQWDAAEGSTPDEKLNFLRRRNYAANKDAINARKRAAYARRIDEKKALDGIGDREYNISPTKVLREMYQEDVDAGWVSSLVSFALYEESYKSVQALIGQMTINGITITGQTRHFIQRVCGTAVDPKIFREEHRKLHRDGVEIEDIIDAITRGRPRPIKKTGGLPSQQFIGKNCIVSINPETGKLIQCNRNTKKFKKGIKDERNPEF